MARKAQISYEANPTRKQASLGNNTRFRTIDGTEDRGGVYLATVTKVYYQKGTLDFKEEHGVPGLVNTGNSDGSGSARIPVEIFGRNAQGQVYGQYRPIKSGDTILVAYIEGQASRPIVLGVYAPEYDYEMVTPSPYNKTDDTDPAIQQDILSDKTIYPSQQLFYQSGTGDMYRSLNGHSFLAISKNDTGTFDNLDIAYDSIGAFYNQLDEEIEPNDGESQAWLLVHEDNPDANESDGHRTRFYVKKDGTVQVVFVNSNKPGLLVLEGSLDTGFTIKKQYDVSTLDNTSSKYVELNVGGDKGFDLDVQNVDMGDVPKAKTLASSSTRTKTNFAVKPDDVYINGKALGDLLAERDTNISDLVDDAISDNKYFKELDQKTKQAGATARQAAQNAQVAGEQARQAAQDTQDRILYYINTSPEKDTYIPGKYLIINTDTFINDGTIKTAHIGEAAITNAKIADLAVDTAQIRDLAITDAKVGSLTFDHMIGEKLDANQIDVVNLKGENISAGTITADKLIIKNLGDITSHLGSITDGSINAGDNGVNINHLPADDPNKWTPAKKLVLKSQIEVLEAEANSAKAYGDSVGQDSTDVQTKKQVLLNGTASLLTDMTATTRFDGDTINGWITDLKQAIEAFRNESTSIINHKIGKSADGKNSITQGTQPPENPAKGDMWFQDMGDGTNRVMIYGDDGWYEPTNTRLEHVAQKVDKMPTNYYQPNQPQGEIHEGDVWYETTNDKQGNITYTANKYEQGKWVPLLDQNASKNTSGTSAPANPKEGDYWYDESHDQLKMWSDSANDWKIIPTTGPQGVPGKDGATTYMHVAYANSADGKTNFSLSYFDNAKYIGLLTNTTEADSDKYAEYTWSRLRGVDGTNGTDGVPGKPGADGKTPYVHFAYANSSDGTSNFTTSNPDGKSYKYVGVYSDYTKADSSNNQKYNWSLIKGAKGDQGDQGVPGKDGATTYMHVAYANSADGKTNFSLSYFDNAKYIGLLTNTTEADSDKYAEYTWSRLRGVDGTNGTDGVPGKPGADGKTPYVHFAYANSSDGTSNFTTSNPDGKSYKYVGVYSDYTKADSSNNQKYNWSLIKGAKGDQGVPGKDGKDGKDGITTYTWVKYATNDSGVNMSDNPQGMTYVGLAFNKTNPNESSTATDYQWSLIKGADGKDGAKGTDGKQGPAGKDGKPTYFHMAYANSSNGKTDFTISPNTDKSYNYFGSYSDNTKADSTKYSDYNWVAMFDSTKKRNFTSTPTTPYDVGDTWTQSGATYFCTTSRHSGAFNQQDWEMQQLTIQSMDNAIKNSVNQIDNLQVGGTNLLTGTSNHAVTGSDTHGYLSNETTDDLLILFKELEGQTVTVSVDYEYSGFVAGSHSNRLGWETYIVADSSLYVGPWYYPKNDSGSGRISLTFVVPKNITNIGEGLGYIQFSGSGTGKLSHLKLEKGTKATDWSPAPEDYVNKSGNYKGVTLNDSGLTATSGSTQVAMNSNDGFLIKNGSKTLLNADKSGNLNMQGNVTAGNISGVNFTGNNLNLAGSLNVTGSISSGGGKAVLDNSGLTMKGGSVTIGNDRGTHTYIRSDGTLLTSNATLSGTLSSNAVTITGGDINMNGGKFHVDKEGNVTAKSFTSDSLLNKGTIDFSNMSVKNLSADNITSGTLTSSNVKITNGSIKTLLDKKGIEQSNSDDHYNAVYNSEFTNNAESWDIGENNNGVDVYLSNLPPVLDGSNRLGTNMNRLGKTYSAGYHTLAKSTPVEIPAGNTKASVATSIYCFNSGGGVTYDYAQINVLYLDKDLKQVGTFNAHITKAQANNYTGTTGGGLKYSINYVKTENNTIPSSAKYAGVSFSIKAPTGGGKGHILFTQPMLCFDARVADYIPSSVSSNQSIDIKNGYISLVSDGSFTIPDYFTNITSYKGPVVQDGRVTLSSGGLEMNEQVHDPKSANTNYFGSTRVDSLGYSTTIADNYKNVVQDVTVRADVGLMSSYHKTRKGEPQYSQLKSDILTLSEGGNAITQVDSAGVYLGKGKLQLYQNSKNETRIVNMDKRIDMGIHPNDAQPTDRNSGKRNILKFYDSGHSTTNGDAILGSNAVFARHYSSGPRVTVTGYGTLGRITSASKYKVGISEMPEIENKAHAFLAVKPKQWHDAGAVEEFANSLSDGVEPETHDGDLHVTPGFIAEDLYTAGLDEYVDRGADGSLEGIEYDRLPTLHHVLIQELFQRVNELENKLEKIERS